MLNDLSNAFNDGRLYSLARRAGLCAVCGVLLANAYHLTVVALRYAMADRKRVIEWEL